jgi:hypothetical protein
VRARVSLIVIVIVIVIVFVFVRVLARAETASQIFARVPFRFLILLRLVSG